MKKLLAAALTLVMLLGCMPECYAAESAVTTLTNAMKNFETEVVVKTQDAEATLQSVFSANPALFYYFESYSATMANNGKKTTYTFTYHNTDVDIDDILVVADSDDMYNVVGYALAQAMDSISFVVTDSNLTEEYITTAISQWREEYYLIYMGYTGVTSTVYTSTESAFSAWTGYTLEFQYLTNSTTLQQWREETLAAIQDLCTTLFALDMPDYEKEYLIHDYIVLHCSYDEEAEDGTYSLENTAYGCLVYGKAVSEGYAIAMQLLLDAAGVNSYYVRGAGESINHYWNCVEIQGSYYWVDAACDDPVPVDGGSEDLYHTYFNVTDSVLNTDHSWQSSQYDSCTSTTWDVTAVKAARSMDTTEYTNYSTENVRTLSSLLSDLQYELGISTKTKKTTTTTTSTTTDTTTSVTVAEEDEDFDLTGLLIKAAIGLAVLIAVYLIYRRIKYMQMLERKVKRMEAGQKRAEDTRKGGKTAGKKAKAKKTPGKAGAKAAPDAADRKKSPSAARKKKTETTGRTSGRKRRNNPFR